jgi:hypothetical protein
MGVFKGQKMVAFGPAQHTRETRLGTLWMRSLSINFVSWFFMKVFLRSILFMYFFTRQLREATTVWSQDAMLFGNGNHT